ncbi:unnamed protein product, partial [Rotaria sp. Silwood2]
PTSTNVGDLHRRLDRNLMRVLFSHFLTQIACIFSFVIVNLLGIFVNKNSTMYNFFFRRIS